MSSTPQSGPKASWLDEELRKEKTIVTELRDTVGKQQVVITDQSQRILTLEDRLAKLQAQLLRIPEVEEALRHTRDELVLMVSALRQDQQKRDAEFLRNRMTEREQDTRAMQELQASLKRFDPLEQAMAVRQAEDRRLNDVALRQQQDLEDLAKRLPQRDESIRQLGDRIEHNVVRTGQAEAAVQQAQKVQQEQAARLLLIETTQGKAEQRIAEVPILREDLSKRLDDFAENQRRSDRDRVQSMTEWGRRIEAYSHQLDVWGDQLRFFTDQHEKNRRVLREVQELGQQVAQQQDTLKQAQRIAEDQLRHESREWRSENERRWAQDQERRDKAFEAQTERNDVQDQRLSDLDGKRLADVAAVAALEKRLLTTRAEYTAESERMRQMSAHLMQMYAKSSQDLLAETMSLLGIEEK